MYIKLYADITTDKTVLSLVLKHTAMSQHIYNDNKNIFIVC